MARFFSSDHHFGHANVIKYCSRPYASVEAMDKDLIKKWNDTVGTDDEVWYLGDFAMGKKALPVVKQLNGIKFLISGNHDTCFPGHKKWLKEENVYKDAGFKYVFSTPQETLIGGFQVLMWHFPYLYGDEGEDIRYKEWRLEDKGKILLHGHIHEKWLKRRKEINVGIDVWEGLPVSENKVYGAIEDERHFISNPWG